jgi:hypothetical protein
MVLEQVHLEIYFIFQLLILIHFSIQVFLQINFFLVITFVKNKVNLTKLLVLENVLDYQ